MLLAGPHSTVCVTIKAHIVKNVDFLCSSSWFPSCNCELCLTQAFLCDSWSVSRIMESCRLNSLIALLTYLLHYSQRIDPLLTHFDQFKTQKSEYVESCNETHSVMDLIFTSCNDTSDINNLLKANKHSHANCYSKCVYISQIGKEHLGLKAITEVLQDLQYKVGQS